MIRLTFFAWMSVINKIGQKKNWDLIPTWPYFDVLYITNIIKGERQPKDDCTLDVRAVRCPVEKLSDSLTNRKKAGKYP